MDNKFLRNVQDWMTKNTCGIGSTKKSTSKNDKRAITVLENTTTLVDEHYQIALLWKENDFLPNDRWLAEKQLKSLKKNTGKPSKKT